MTVTVRLDEVDNDPQVKRTLDDIASLVAKRRRIVVVTGAGISCSSGIPDFRSSDGLYNMLQQRHPDVLLKGSDLFDASLFRDPATLRLFYQFIAELKTSIDNAEPSLTHHFISTLNAKGRLVRSYTQNIDGFEERLSLLGSSSEDARCIVNGKTKIKTKEIRSVQLHGDIHRLRCVVCYTEYQCSDEYLELLRQGSAPPCRECIIRCEDRVARAARSLRVGLLRPAIVLYQEHHPNGEDIGNMCSLDISRKPDLLLIMGTSLKVHGVKKLVKEFAKAVHERPSSGSPRNATTGGQVIFVNKSPPGAEWAEYIDYHVQGETDAWVENVMAEWRRIRPADFEAQPTLMQSFDALKLTKAPRLSIKIPPQTKRKADPENVPPLSSPPPGITRLKIVIPLLNSKRRRGDSSDSDNDDAAEHTAAHGADAEQSTKLIIRRKKGRTR